MQLTSFTVRPLVEQALREELGPGDTTGGFLTAPGDRGTALIYVKKPSVVCGLLLAEETIRAIEPTAEVTYEAQDGDQVRAGDVLLRVNAHTVTLFTIERVALDWIQQLSGIATKTHRYMKQVEPHGVRVTDTRKGFPGTRLLQKYAVRVGGGHNHLFGLHNAILIKDNHIKVAGSITRAVTTLRARAQHTFKIEVECETLEQVEEALDAGAEVIMFDNMDLATMRNGVNRVGDRAVTEASGGIGEDNIAEIASLGVDVISVGDLTHSVQAIDVSLDLGDIKPSAQRAISQEEELARA